MKLHLQILEKFIDLPTKDAAELRHMLDDLGLEVKDIAGESGKEIFNIETLANRGDHLSAIGVAREISARTLSAVKLPSLCAALPERKPAVPVRKNTELCMRYGLLEMTLPADMALRSDVRAVVEAQEVKSPKPAIVDILNYVQLELGQPMHAFDRDKIDGEIIIDCLDKAADIRALDGKDYRVPPGSIVIRDRKQIVAVAGVIGCENSMVTSATTRILIESASFDPVQVRKTARAMGISTDASYCFERGCDIEAVPIALRRVVFLAEGSAGTIKEAGGAHPVGYTCADSPPPAKRKITLGLAKLRAQMNLPRLSEVEVLSRLKLLGFQGEFIQETKNLQVIVPSWRMWDVHDDDDLVEEVARCFSLSKVKLELPPLDYEPPEIEPMEKLLSRIEPPLLGAGFFEVITKSFYSAEDKKIIESISPVAGAAHIGVDNAVEKAYSQLKVTNVLHLCRVAQANLKRGVEACKAYEVGRLFSRSIGAMDGKSPWEFERDALSLVAAGRWYSNRWRKGESIEQKLMLFKGVLENVLSAAGFESGSSVSKEALLHPGMQLGIKAGRSICGFFGVLHPRILQELDMREEVLYAELDLNLLCSQTAAISFEMPSDLPSVRRDMTLKVSLREMAARIVRIVQEARPEFLSMVEVVDDFKKSEEDFRRLTLRLTFHHNARTLEHSEVDKSIQHLWQILRDKHQLEMAA